MAQKTGRKLDEQNFDMTPILLAVVYESIRLLPAGPLLQRCSLQQGNYFFLDFICSDN